MKLERINNIKSEKFKRAVELGDNNSKTLGFLPYVAFQKYAEQNQLIGAYDENNDDLFGYLLYRISYNRVTIVHLCIDKKHRGKKAAKRLFEYLKKHTKQYEGIRLSCKKEYGIDAMWESFNFVPMKEKAGRSKKGSTLTVWWFPHYKTNLLTQISDYELSNKIVAVIDTNILLDIKNEREEESLALKSDWLLSEAILYYTREIYNEINRNEQPETRESSRTFLSQFKELPFKNEDEFSDRLAKINTEFSQKNINDKSDLRHIVYSITGGAQFFITRDENLLKNKDFFSKYNLTIYRPSEFITHLDENIQISKYKPQRLIGTNINSKRITSDNIDFFVAKFLTSHEKKNHLQEIVRKSLSFPKEYELTTISKNDNLLAFIIFDRTENNKLKIPIFRFLKSDLKKTLAKHLLFKAIFTATQEQKILIEINEEYLDVELLRIIEETRFVQINNSWQKININGVLKESDIYSKVNKIAYNNEDTEKILSTIAIKNNKTDDKYEFVKKYNSERYLSPLKIEDFEIPTFIVPIKPHWAEILFDDKSKEKLALFEPEYELLLNRENVYYRSAKPKILKAPARILWYLSENKKQKKKGQIRATSYIDEVFIDTPKKLFKQFKQLGVYDWKQISETAGEKKEIMAFVFSDTELFTNSITINMINELFENHEDKKFMVVAPVEIKKETYIALYKLGMQL